MNFRTLFLAVALLAVTPMCFAAQFAIDDFVVEVSITDNTENGVAVTDNSVNVGDGGADRLSSVSSLTGLASSLDITGGFAFFSQNAGNSNADFFIEYDNFTDGDFGQVGTNNFIQVDFLSIEANTVFSTFNLRALDGNGTDVTLNLADAINTALGLNGAQGQLDNVSFTVDFTDFTAVDFSNINTFSLAANFSAEKDISLSFISANAVPEPGTYFMIALLGLVAFVRGRKKMVVENK